MKEKNSKPRGEGSYFIEAENAAEMARLINLNHILTRCMGGPFPPQIDVTNAHDILDIACGPGGWVMDVAKAYPDKLVTGVDISQIMIEFARYQAAEQELHNANFLVMDATKPLNFPDALFDFVNARFISGFMSKAAWPRLVQECQRILRPGGTIRLTEFEAYISNAFSVERLMELATRAIYNAGQSFSPSGWQAAVTPMLERFLRDAGFQHLQKAAYVVDGSTGSEEHSSQYQNVMVFFKQLQPFLVKAEVATQEEAESLYQRALEEMVAPDYCALWYFLSAWSEKPREES